MDQLHLRHSRPLPGHQALILLSRRGRCVAAVHKRNLPDSPLSVKKRRVQPLQLRRTRGVGDAALIHIGDPGSISTDMYIRVDYAPRIVRSLGMCSLGQVHNTVSVVSRAPVVEVKPRCSQRVKLRQIIMSGCIEDLRHRIGDLLLVHSQSSPLRCRNSRG